MSAAYRTIHRDHHHFGWNRAFEPVAEIAPGDTLELDVLDASAGRITRASTHADVADLDPAFANPVTGPVRIDGAAPGDALVIEIVELVPSGWGWTAVIPGFGLLADEIPGPWLIQSTHDDTNVALAPGIRLPLSPFPGTIGVAPAAAGTHAAIPPRRMGGNLDMKGLVAGARLVLPVEVPGALFSVGDTHAAQGDGEVCGTAVESPMRVVLRFALERGAAPRMPRAELPARRSSVLDRGTVSVTLGVADSLESAARNAVREMIGLIMARHGAGAELAYCICSTAVDLRISETVNEPNRVVSAYLPNAIFD